MADWRILRHGVSEKIPLGVPLRIAHPRPWHPDTDEAFRGRPVGPFDIHAVNKQRLIHLSDKREYAQWNQRT